ncbi:hypothetical protein K7X08_005846 [Anisodus acutangulus]|uniref:Uncharacterized protein n=1 Tax=Anisodus acutangulus TaxID=402998 RepID=A0A9Q1LVA9_9SOLA|nr:hypothetical protein K7X08_005846 [Anisodus acutangulus]
MGKLVCTEVDEGNGFLNIFHFKINFTCGSEISRTMTYGRTFYRIYKRKSTGRVPVYILFGFAIQCDALFVLCFSQGKRDCAPNNQQFRYWHRIDIPHNLLGICDQRVQDLRDEAAASV